MLQKRYSIGDKALMILSYKRDISWPTFRRAAVSLLATELECENDTDRTRPRPYWLLSILSSLGHCDFSFVGASRVVIAPPMIARLPLAGAPQAVLVGARSASTLDELQDTIRRYSDAGVEVSSGSQDPLSPTRVLIQSASPADLVAVANKLNPSLTLIFKNIIDSTTWKAQKSRKALQTASLWLVPAISGFFGCPPEQGLSPRPSKFCVVRVLPGSPCVHEGFAHQHNQR